MAATFPSTAGRDNDVTGPSGTQSQAGAAEEPEFMGLSALRTGPRFKSLPVAAQVRPAASRSVVSRSQSVSSDQLSLVPDSTELTPLGQPPNPSSVPPPQYPVRTRVDQVGHQMIPQEGQTFAQPTFPRSAVNVPTSYNDDLQLLLARTAQALNLLEQQERPQPTFPAQPSMPVAPSQGFGTFANFPPHGRILPNISPSELFPDGVPPSLVATQGGPPSRFGYFPGGADSIFQNEGPQTAPLKVEPPLNENFSGQQRSTGLAVNAASTGGCPANEASASSLPSTNEPSLGQSVSRSALNQVFPNKISGGANAAEEDKPPTDPQQQQTTVESVLEELKMFYSMDPISMIEKGYLPTLKGSNYLEWAVNMERYLKAQGLWPTWNSFSKYFGCPNQALHEIDHLKYYQCTQLECMRRDRIDAAGLLVLVMSCQPEARSLLMRQNTMESAWILLEHTYVRGIREHTPDYEWIHPVYIMQHSNGAVGPFEDQKISDFFMDAFRQWCDYLYAVDTYFGMSMADPKYISEAFFLKNVIGFLPDRPPYQYIKAYWLPRLEVQPRQFFEIYGWLVAMEREGTAAFIPPEVGVTRMPGCG
ncbi:hypothetical protein TWF730_008977 [Orbilia blumenaviensis]|uniref:DUF4219 domain-containing protein n=1 Tax=Orbilia blumenaviensis TaxID=1796055 RepID=A0AAV9V043_9PEZI